MCADTLIELATTDRDLLVQIRSFFPDLKITENDLKNPSRLIIVEFYKLALNEFSIDVLNVMQPQMSQVNFLNGNVDMFNDLVPLINLTEAIKFLGIPAFSNFSVLHLLNPMPKVTSTYMAHMMYFIYFADGKINQLQPKLDHVSELIKRKTKLESYKDELKMKITDRASQMKSILDKSKDMDIEYDRIQNNMEKLNMDSERLQKDLEEAKLKHSRVTTVHEGHFKENQMIENDVKELKRQIKEMKSQQNSAEESSQQLSIDVLKMKAKDTAEKHDELRNTLENRQLVYEVYLNSQKENSGLSSQLEQISKFIEQNNEIEKKLSQIITEKSCLEEKIKGFESSNNVLRQEYDKRVEHFTGIKLQWARQESSLKQALDEAQKENKSMAEKFSGTQKKVKEINEERKVLNQKIKRNEEYFKKLTDAYKKAYEADCKARKEMEAQLLQKLEAPHNKNK